MFTHCEDEDERNGGNKDGYTISPFVQDNWEVEFNGVDGIGDNEFQTDEPRVLLKVFKLPDFCTSGVY